MTQKKLYEFGDGILRTHVTWEEIQEKVKELFGEKAVFGPNKTATSIGDGRGFMSKMCLVDPDWSEETEAPKKFILKIPSQITMVEACEKMKIIKSTTPNPVTQEEENQFMQMIDLMTPAVKNVHNTEVMMYDLLQKHHTDVPRPQIFASLAFETDDVEQGYLLMEYKENSLNLNIYDNITVEDVKQALRGIAALEVASLNFTEEEAAKLQTNTLKELFNTMLCDQSSGQMITELKGFGGHLFLEKIDELEKLLKVLMDGVNSEEDPMTELGKSLGMKKVLVHGDCWSTNFLWRKKENSEDLVLAAMVDFQTCHMGHPASDLFRLFAASLSGKDRKAHWEELVEYFYSSLLEQLNGSEAPYTLEQLKENYRQYTPLGCLFIIPMILPVMQMNQANPDPETKEKVQNLVLEKVEGLLDDLLKGHKYNIERKK